MFSQTIFGLGTTLKPTLNDTFTFVVDCLNYNKSNVIDSFDLSNNNVNARIDKYIQSGEYCTLININHILGNGDGTYKSYINLRLQ